jgi:hypothetical protein
MGLLLGLMRLGSLMLMWVGGVFGNIVIRLGLWLIGKGIRSTARILVVIMLLMRAFML